MGPVELVFLAVPLAIVVLLLFGLRRTTRREEAEELGGETSWKVRRNQKVLGAAS